MDRRVRSSHDRGRGSRARAADVAGRRVGRAAGVGRPLAPQLYVAGDDLGALNLFSTRVDAFDDEDERIALLFAAHAAVAMADAQATERWERAVSTRDLIGQAKGILMERFRITDHQAFLPLVRASMAVNATLTSVAEELVRSGELRRPKPAASLARPVS